MLKDFRIFSRNEITKKNVFLEMSQLVKNMIDSVLPVCFH